MKRWITLLLCCCLLAALVGCASKTETKGLEIHFSVTHAITTTATNLAEALKQEGLVEESAASAGLYDVVNGEKADWNDGEAWWCFSKDGEALTVGIEETELVDGANYEAVFTRGFGE